MRILAMAFLFALGCTPATDDEIAPPDENLVENTEALTAERPVPIDRCDRLERRVHAELFRISACLADRQCGQVLTGTSCGCTRNKVARNNARTGRFYRLMERWQDECGGGFISTCDCPPADGFVCARDENSFWGTCAWNYVDRPVFPLEPVAE